MVEKIYYLPGDFVRGEIAETAIHFYSTNQSSRTNKISFNYNLLCFVLQGQKEVIDGLSRTSIGNDSIFLLPGGNTLMAEKTTLGNSYKSILFFFSTNFLREFTAQAKLTKSRIGPSRSNLRAFKKDAYISNFENSLLMLGSKLNINHRMAEAKLREILLYLLERDEVVATEFMLNALQRDRDLPFFKIINSQVSGNLTIEELAFLCNMSVSTFKRKFAEVFHTTPKKYFVEQKMKEAVDLLVQNWRPSEIFAKLGYENLSSFSSEFKKCFGVSPKMYARQR